MGKSCTGIYDNIRRTIVWMYRGSFSMNVYEKIRKSKLRSVAGKMYWMLTVVGNTIINKIPSRRLRKLYFKLLGAKIDSNSVLYRRVELMRPYNFKMGRGSSVGWFSLVDARGGISIGNNVTVASYCKLVTAKHDIDNNLFPAIMEPIIIEDYAWICTGAMILSGVTIGKGAVVCAGAVVTKDVLPMTVVGGVPAKMLKKRSVVPIFEDDLRWSWLN